MAIAETVVAVKWVLIPTAEEIGSVAGGRWQARTRAGARSISRRSESGSPSRNAAQQREPDVLDRSRSRTVGVTPHPPYRNPCIVHWAKAARIRAQLRVPLWKLFTSYFSFGECTRSS